MREIMTKQKKETSMKRNNLIKKFLLYLILLIITAAMLIPFIWMLSASIKTDREVFQMTPFVLIPETPRWSNYVDIWTKIPFGTFVKNTVFLTIVVTALQLLTSSFAAYSFASSSIRMHCSWHTLRPSLCRGRYTWFRSLS
jgi:multiple sugar transport system permease protein